MSKIAKFFFIKAQASGQPAQISIRGVIGDSWDDATWTVKNTEDEVLAALAGIPKGTKAEVHINSEGGSMQCALGIHNVFNARADDLTFYNDGYMCSSAAILPPKGSKVICPQASFVMIHNPYAYFEGDSDDAEKAMQALKAHNDVYAGIIAERTGKTKDSILALMKAETWWTGTQAVEMGYATDDSGAEETDFDGDEVNAKKALAIFARFKKTPENLRSRIHAKASAVTPPPTKTTPTKENSMKKITAALVAAGIITASAEEHTEETMLPHINALLADNKRLKAENEGHVNARKSRITAAVEAAVTDKVIAETRKASLINFGTGSAEGETEVIAQIADLRAAKTAAASGPRGAKPAKFVAENATTEEIEARLEEIQTQIESSKTVPEIRAALVRESLNLRGLGNITKAQTTAAVK